MIEAWRHWRYWFGRAGGRDPLHDMSYLAYSYVRAVVACVEVLLCYCYNSTIFAVAALARVHMLLLWHIVLPLLFPLLYYLPTGMLLLFVEDAIISNLSVPLFIAGIVTCLLVLVYNSIRVHCARIHRHCVDLPATPSNHLEKVYVKLMNGTTVAKVMFYEYELYCICHGI